MLQDVLCDDVRVITEDTFGVTGCSVCHLVFLVTEGPVYAIGCLCSN